MPSAVAGETLLERAQRILQIDLDVLLGESDTDAVTPPTKRSEQIAQAQRKHRKRTQGYIQALENEVLRLRVREKDLVIQLETKTEHSTDAMNVDTINNDPVAVSSDEPLNSTETTMIDWNEMLNLAPEVPCCIKGAEQTPPVDHWSPTDGFDITAHSHSFDNATNQTNNNTLENGITLESSEIDNKSSVSSNKLGDSLSSVAGIHLILKLERPCLSHLKYATTTEPVAEGLVDFPYNFGMNHCYNLSTKLYHDYQSLDSTQHNDNENINVVSSSSLKSLLDASEKLQLADEMTPVQIWSLVSKLNAINPVDPSIINLMFEELAKHSYCNSFGTAIRKNTVKAALRYYLGWFNEQ